MNKLILFSIAIVSMAMFSASCGKGNGAKASSDSDHVLAATTEEQPRDPNRMWCGEHDVYEDECYICHPELKPSDGHDDGHGHAQSEDSGAPGASTLMCKEHRLPEQECGICRPDALSTVPIGQGLKVRFASKASISKAGIVLGQPASATSGGGQELLGQVSFNRNQLANVTPLVTGVVVEVHKDVGDVVQAGDTLASVQSPEIAQVTSEYLKAAAEARLASQSLSREQDLFKKEISARQDLEAAQAASAVSQSAVNESRQHLLNLGLTQAEVDTAVKGRAASVVPVRAPFAGTVIARTAVHGSAVEPGVALFQVADLSAMWMQLSVPESRLASVHAGAQIQARFDAYPEKSFDGTIEWIAPAIDGQSRMVQARAVIANPEGLLKDGLFGRATIAGLVKEDEVTVPASAVQDVDGRQVVFRRIEDDLYETRLVEAGPAVDGRITILAGLALEDEIVTEGSNIMKSEFLKERLGAGCAEH
ncbi:MAG: efflux RND transporter periplasmic adaptor subunit [Candidatus Hydrogenedentales bacterium]|jgi:cobalt-zinc-cadmium efflux system membrane fusion protein